jgi:hypothetical protein
MEYKGGPTPHFLGVGTANSANRKGKVLEDFIL